MLLMTVDFFIKRFAIKIYTAIIGNVLFLEDINNAVVLFFHYRFCFGQLADLCFYVCQLKTGRLPPVGAKSGTDAFNAVGCFSASADYLDGIRLYKPIYH